MTDAQLKHVCPHCHWGFWNPTILKQHIREKHPDVPELYPLTPANPLVEAAPDMLAALKVVFLTPATNRWLAVNDPQALKQIGKAVAKAMNIPVDWDTPAS